MFGKYRIFKKKGEEVPKTTIETILGEKTTALLPLLPLLIIFSSLAIKVDNFYIKLLTVLAFGVATVSVIWISIRLIMFKNLKTD